MDILHVLYTKPLIFDKATFTVKLCPTDCANFTTRTLETPPKEREENQVILS